MATGDRLTTFDMSITALGQTFDQLAITVYDALAPLFRDIKVKASLTQRREWCKEGWREWILGPVVAVFFPRVDWVSRIRHQLHSDLIGCWNFHR